MSIRRVAFTLLATAGVCLGQFSANAETNSSDLDAIKKEIAALRQENAALRERDRLQSENMALRERMRLKSENAALRDRASERAAVQAPQSLEPPAPAVQERRFAAAQPASAGADVEVLQCGDACGSSARSPPNCGPHLERTLHGRQLGVRRRPKPVCIHPQQSCSSIPCGR
jgi:hypothetical protein